VEGAVIEIGLILIGLASIGLGLWNFRDWRRSTSQFSPIETEGLNTWWKRTARIQRFNHHLDIWIFLILGPASIALGIYAMLK
jgi:hypothetical protein